jgi:hypothetical protein
MERILDVILIIGVLIVIYYCIQKYKNIKNNKENKSEISKDSGTLMNIAPVNNCSVLETFIEPKVQFSYEYNMGGNGKTLKEIYDNSFVDFKKLIPKKNIIDTELGYNSMQAASNLNYLTPDNWVYENEKQENGGKSIEGIYASDPSVYGVEAVFL